MLHEYKRAWFEEWFDSPYYTQLYRHRDEDEARRFIDVLIEQLKPASGSKMLDLACGRGRFSRYLAQKGFDVTGLDLSDNSIAFAKSFEHETLRFFRHDMREPLPAGPYDYIFSFFTSFGYFGTDREHQDTLHHVYQGLKPGGVFVLDFLNADQVRAGLPQREEKNLEGVSFRTEKFEDQGFVIKTIDIDDYGRKSHFRERVRLFTCENLRTMLVSAGFAVQACLGDYQLQVFSPESSPRLIFIVTRD
jgi:cyclopropane fatty-acyl-phospholipid synthase-like methyltransferase